MMQVPAQQQGSIFIRDRIMQNYFADGLNRGILFYSPDKGDDMETILRDIAPCGLVCRTCVSGKSSVIREQAERLNFFLDGFDDLAKRIASFDPTYEKYPDFKIMLDKFANPGCEGCRDGKGIHTACIIPGCIKERGIDFCAQCEEFPCDRTGFMPALLEKWHKSTAELRELGVEKYHERAIARSHY